MSQDGSTILDRLTNRGEQVDMVRGGKIGMEMSILVDGRRAIKQKVGCLNYRKMADTRSMNVRITS